MVIQTNNTSTAKTTVKREEGFQKSLSHQSIVKAEIFQKNSM
jgi:hypothetical protein